MWALTSAKRALTSGSEFFEVRTNRRRDILASGGGDIGDRVGDGQRVEIELRQGDSQAPRLMPAAAQWLRSSQASWVSVSVVVCVAAWWSARSNRSRAL